MDLLLHKWYRSDPGNTRLPKETIQQRRKEWMQEEAYQKGVIHFKNLENWKQEFYFPLKRLEAERNLPIEDRLYLRNSEAEYSELLSYVAPEEVLMKNCTRCRRMLTYGSARKLPCGHMFHMKCAQPRDRWGIKTCLKCRVQFHFMDLPDLNYDWKFPPFKSRHALGMFATDEEREVWMKACDWI